MRKTDEALKDARNTARTLKRLRARIERVKCERDAADRAYARALATLDTVNDGRKGEGNMTTEETKKELLRKAARCRSIMDGLVKLEFLEANLKGQVGPEVLENILNLSAALKHDYGYAALERDAVEDDANFAAFREERLPSSPEKLERECADHVDAYCRMRTARDTLVRVLNQLLEHVPHGANDEADLAIAVAAKAADDYGRIV